MAIKVRKPGCSSVCLSILVKLVMGQQLLHLLSVFLLASPLTSGENSEEVAEHRNGESKF